MPDLEALAATIVEQVAALVQPTLKRLETEFSEKLAAIEAASVRDIEISGGEVVLTFGDGQTRSLGEIKGQDGQDGRDGADAPAADLSPLLARLGALEGLSIVGTLIDRGGGLVLIRADGSSLAVGPVVGRDGTDGEIGPAGLGFEDLDVTLGEDGRTLAIKFERGEVAETFELELPVMIYRGVYVIGRDYRPGDAVTFGGSVWACNAPTSARPGEGEGPWTLAVKRGRDGKDFAGPSLKPKAVA